MVGSFLKNRKIFSLFFRGNWQKFCAKIIPDKRYIEWKYEKRMGKRLDLHNPQTFTEKLQWLSLYWHDDLLTQCADKYEVRNFVAERVGTHILKKLYNVYANAHEIKFEELPNSFALKINHGTKQMVLCRDKEKLDWQYSVRLLNAYLKNNNYYKFHEWAYKNIKPLILCEEHLTKDGNAMQEYNFFCYDGVPRLVEISEKIEGVSRVGMYDLDLNPLCRKYKSLPIITPIEATKQYYEMLSYADKLSQGFPFVRVDFSYAQNRIYFGEMTFYPLGGMAPYNPKSFDEFLGAYLKLPPKKPSLQSERV